jgi:hypothetical protein
VKLVLIYKKIIILNKKISHNYKINKVKINFEKLQIKINNKSAKIYNIKKFNIKKIILTKNVNKIF